MVARARPPEIDMLHFVTDPAAVSSPMWSSHRAVCNMQRMRWRSFVVSCRPVRRVSCSAAGHSLMDRPRSGRPNAVA